MKHFLINEAMEIVENREKYGTNFSMEHAGYYAMFYGAMGAVMDNEEMTPAKKIKELKELRAAFEVGAELLKK